MDGIFRYIISNRLPSVEMLNAFVDSKCQCAIFLGFPL